MFIVNSRNDIAQIESDEVDLVRDLRIGERPRRTKYIKTADLAVDRRSEVRCENGGLCGV